jgi:hypothetical protein
MGVRFRVRVKIIHMGLCRRGYVGERSERERERGIDRERE